MPLHGLGVFRFFAQSNLARNGLQNVMVGQQAFDAAIFVHHQRYVFTGLLEELEYVQRVDASRHEQRFLQHRLQINGLAGQIMSQQVFGMNDAGDVIQTAAAHGETRIAALFDFCPHLIVGGVGIQPDDLRPRRHQRPRTSIAQAEDGFHHILFRFFENARLGPLLDQRFDFLFGNRRLLNIRFAKNVEHRVGRYAEQMNDRRGDCRQCPHGASHGGCDPLGMT